MQDIKSILIGITEEGDPQETSSTALAYGLSLAQKAQAHLTIQAASLRLVLTSPMISDFAVALVAEENRRLHALAETVAERARGNAAAAGVTCTTQVPFLEYPSLVASFKAQARVHDLTILDAEPSSLVMDRGLIEAMILDTGRPLLVVPPGVERFEARRVIIAWDGSAKAARAVHDALPFLKEAEEVHILCVTGEKDLSDTLLGADLAPALARHGIKAVVHQIPAVEGDAAEALRRCAVEMRAEMIVMGAYVHSRLREMLFGGVTQSLLRAPPAPLFMAA